MRCRRARRTSLVGCGPFFGLLTRARWGTHGLMSNDGTRGPSMEKSKLGVNPMSDGRMSAQDQRSYAGSAMNYIGERNTRHSCKARWINHVNGHR